jgi:phosphoglycolate phosphatase
LQKKKIIVYKTEVLRMKQYHTIAFDLDGTLTNPERGLTNSYKYGLRKIGLNITETDSLKKFIGPPLRDSFQEEYGLTLERAEEALQLFREYFGVYGWWDNELYPGIAELLSALKAAGKTVILATSKPEIYSSRILKLFGIDGYFDFSEGASLDSSRERKCDVLEYALSKVGVITPEQKAGAVLIGDTVYDVEGANIVGIDSLAVTYGFGKEEDLRREGATYIAHTVSDIADILCK